MGYIEKVADQVLPQGWLKETVRRFYRRQYNPLYGVARSIRSITRLDAETILVELQDGYRLVGPSDGILRPVFSYARPSRLGLLQDFGRWATFFQIIGEIYVSHIYTRRYTLRPGDVVLDLGAHVGAFTIYAAKQVGPAGRVIAFEPYSRNFRLLEENIRLNGLSNVIALNRGAWDRAGELDLVLSELSGSHSMHASSSVAPRSGGIERVHVDTVDHSLAELMVETAQFVKMDIEGAELEVLRGMEHLLRSNPPSFAIAAYHTVGGRQTSSRVADRLAAHGLLVEAMNNFVYAGCSVRS